MRFFSGFLSCATGQRGSGGGVVLFGIVSMCHNSCNSSSASPLTLSRDVSIHCGAQLMTNLITPVYLLPFRRHYYC